MEKAVNEAVDIIVMAGDRSGSRSVSGKNKLFLEFENIPLLIHGVRALEEVDRIAHIYIVGPSIDIKNLLADYKTQLKNNKPIEVLEQQENIYQNFWSAFTHMIPGYYEGIEKTDLQIMDKRVLALAADLPFITANEINEFLDNCSNEELDYCLGMTEERYLRPFYPSAGKPGIKMTYLHLREGNYRLNNLHLIKPFRILNRSYVKTVYERRYQKRPFNIVKMVYDFIFTEGFGFKPLALYAILELAILCRFLGITSIVNWLRKRASKEEVSAYAGVLLKTRIGIVTTTIGGCATDIDNDKDFITATEMYHEWITMLNQPR